MEIFERRNNFCSLTFLLITFLTLISYQNVSSADRNTVMKTLSGKVAIKLEPHGSIRASIFQGQALQYEFILDRDTPQTLLTQNIDRANIYLIGTYGEELVIDDLKMHKRYLLSAFDRTGKHKGIPSARRQAIVIKGYSISLLQ